MLVADRLGNGYNPPIAGAVMGLARRPGLGTAARGVSNAEQARFPQGMGCDRNEGEWISMPEPADRCAALIQPARRPGKFIQGFKTT